MKRTYDLKENGIGTQMHITLIVSAYRKISERAVLILAGIQPVDFLALDGMKVCEPIETEGAPVK